MISLFFPLCISFFRFIALLNILFLLSAVSTPSLFPSFLCCISLLWSFCLSLTVSIYVSFLLPFYLKSPFLLSLYFSRLIPIPPSIVILLVPMDYGSEIMRIKWIKFKSQNHVRHELRDARFSSVIPTSNSLDINIQSEYWKMKPMLLITKPGQ